MAKVVKMSELPLVEQQPGDLSLVLREGIPYRVPAFTGGELPTLAAVATTGSYLDLLNLPTLGSAAAMNAAAFATAAQGGRADSALQPAAIGVSIQGYSAVLAGSTASFTTALKTKVDGIAAGATANATDAALRARSSHTGTQAIATIVDLQAALDDKVAKIAGKGLSTEDYSTAEKAKLAGAEPGAQVNVAPVDNLTTPDATKALSAEQGRVLKGLIDSINTLLASDDTNLDELQEIVEFVKLNRAELDALGISSIAGLESALAGKQPIATVLTNTTASFTSALLTKLSGVATGATANATNAQLRDRSTHTGTQAASTVTGLATVATSGSYGDLIGKPAIPAGTVTSVGVSVPVGLSVSGSPVTTSGTFAISYTAGYSIPTTAKQGQWDTAYGWGNHASAGYATTSALASGLAGKVNADDVRLTDAREWTASTVTQATAEAGTNTARFAWTSQRVRQNVAVYAYSKSEVDGLISSATSGGTVWQATITTLPKNTASKVDFSTPRTLTLPAAPAENDYVEILRTAGDSTGSAIARNGATIMGLAENVTIDSNINYLRLDYVNSSWRIAS